MQSDLWESNHDERVGGKWSDRKETCHQSDDEKDADRPSRQDADGQSPPGGSRQRIRRNAGDREERRVRVDSVSALFCNPLRMTRRYRLASGYEAMGQRA
jgi:hypothetical protein